ncbi:glycosyltransferase [uncultured Veillonella sp.]|uniref:glycosyltransferase n=1 Tax=uncultured Veillonella sp. TaxID=159268 RepID=UPI002594156D|nr:glycosyltransferase [uncultured Veillonella sp.]
MKIKVLQFISSIHTGGAETLVKEYAQKIDKEKFHVEILCFNRLDSPYEKLLQESNITVTFLSDHRFFIDKVHPNLFERAFNKILRYILVRQYIRKMKPDIIHFHLNIASYVNFASPKEKAVIFYTHHSAPQRLLSDRWYRGTVENIKSLIKKYRVHILALHDEMKNELQDIFKFNNISVLNNGVDGDRFRINLNKSQAKQRLGFAETDVVIGHVGRFVQLKNHVFLLKVFRQVKNKVPAAKLLLVGSGELKNKILREAKLLGIDEDIKILENRLDIPEIMKAMDCFVFPSISEGLGIVTIEAQFAGCTVVTSEAVDKRTAISNLIQYVSLDRSESDWANTILDCITDCDEKKIQYYGLESWDMKYVIKKLEKLYEDEYATMHVGAKERN